MPVTLPVTLVNGVVPVAEDFMANFNALKIAYDALENTGAVTPAGIVKGFAGTVVPTGWLNCDGAAVSRSGYSGLFAAIGTAWGVGDGSTTFNVPDLRGRTLIGAGVGTGLSARTLATLLGEERHALSVAELAAHSHGVNDPQHAHNVTAGGPTAGGSLDFLFGSGGHSGFAPSEGAPTNISIQSAGSGTAHNIMQPSAVIQWVIKT